MSTDTVDTPTRQKLDELHGLISKTRIAMMTTRRSDGRLVSRPMETQERDEVADLWFVTNVDTDKVDELEQHPEVNLGYLDDTTREWVSVSGIARISRDRESIRRLYQDDWRMWFEDEGGLRNGGPEDPRLALILVEVESVLYSRQKHTLPRTLFEVAKGRATGERPDIARTETLTAAEV